MVIVALDHVPHCYTYADGLAIAELMAAKLRRGETVLLSFRGVNGVPSSFVNGAFASLVREFSAAFIRTHVRVVDSTRQINEMIKVRVEGLAVAGNLVPA